MPSSSALGFLLLMTFPLLGGNDLLDLTTPEAYWKDKGVETTVDAMLGELRTKEDVDISKLIAQLGADQFREREAAMKKIREIGPRAIDQLEAAAAGANPEIADRAKTLVKQLRGSEVAPLQRRLMAIRTLGELKRREALPTLEKLRTSKEPFVAEYAEAAIAAIEGKPFSRPRPTKRQRDEDLLLLPKECVFVLQAGAESRVAMRWDQILRQVAQLPGNEDRDAAIVNYQREFRNLLSRAANVRIDMATVGIAGGLLGADIVVVFRGRYHPASFVEEARKLGFAHTKVHGFDVVQDPLVGHEAVILASEERLILVASPYGKVALDGMIAAVAKGRGTFADNADFVQLVDTIDRTKPMWAATMPDEDHLGLLGLDGLESMTLEVAQESEGLLATCKVRTRDFAAMKKKLDEIMKARDSFVPTLKQMQSIHGHYKPLVELVESLKLSDDGKQFTFTAAIAKTAELLTLPVIEGRRTLE